MQNLSNIEKIYFIDKLLDAGDGDTGRLSFIKECLENNKRLFKSDQKYLASKLEHITIPEEPAPKQESLLDSVRELINSGIGDPGRLEHIYRMLDNGKELYSSDKKYLDSKLEFKEKKFAKIITDIATDIESPTQEQIMQEATEVVALRQKLNDANDKILNLEKTIAEKKSEQAQVKQQAEAPKPKEPEKPKLRGSMPKDWKPSKDLPEDLGKSGIYETIKHEAERIEELKEERKRLDEKQNRLTQIILNREEYEKRVAYEKQRLESKITQERQQIEQQTKLAEQIKERQRELEQAKQEREKISKDLERQQSAITAQIKSQQSELEKTKSDYQKKSQSARKKQEKIEEKIRAEKNKIQEQDKILQYILAQEDLFEKIQSERKEIANQVLQEKTRLYEQNQLAANLGQKELSLNELKSQKNQILNEVKKDKSLLKEIQQEKSKLERHIKVNLKKVEASKKQEESQLSQLISAKQSMVGDIQNAKITLDEQNRLAADLAQKEASLDKIKSEKQEILDSVTKDKNLLKEIKQEKSKIQRQITGNLKKIEQSKKSEEAHLAQLIQEQQNIIKEIKQEKDTLSKAAKEALEMKAKQEALEKTQEERKAIERQIKEAAKELEKVKKERKKISKPKKPAAKKPKTTTKKSTKKPKTKAKKSK